MTPAAAAHRIRENTLVWEGVLAGPAATVGDPDETPLARGRRVRDLHRAGLGRPPLGSDADPVEVAADLALAADELCARVEAEENGGELVPDLAAHVHAVEREAWACRHQVTVAAYDAAAEAYRDATAAEPADTEAAAVADLAARLGRGARVLEIGSGGGRDARALEAAGLSVRRTDVSPAFVRLLREAGHDADVVDPLTDDLEDPAALDAPARPGERYDAVWANACLLHVARPDLPRVLDRLATATRTGGLLRVSMKEGDGEAWSAHGSIDLPRSFTYWREEPLVAALAGARWRVERLERFETTRDSWLATTAVRAPRTPDERAPDERAPDERAPDQQGEEDR